MCGDFTGSGTTGVKGGYKCSYQVYVDGYTGSDNTFIKSRSGNFFYGVRAVVRDQYGNLTIVKSDYADDPTSYSEGTVNFLADEFVLFWSRWWETHVFTFNREIQDYKVVEVCVTIVDGIGIRPEFGVSCAAAIPPEPQPGSCDLGGPYYLTHGLMDAYYVNGNEARVNIDVTCTEDATLTFMAPNELDLGLNIVSQITLDGQKPDGLKLEFSKPGRALLFSSKLQTIGKAEVGTFDKVYLLQATIQ